MNTEKLEKLKKSLDNKFIPDNMKEKIRAEIQKLEMDIKKDENITATEVKEEVKEIEKKVEVALEVAEKKEEQVEAKKPTRTRKITTPKPKAKTVSKTTTAKKATSATPKKSSMKLAKEIRKPGEKWTDALKRASATMRGETKETTKKVSTELQKLKAFVKRRKELKGISETNLVSDAKRKGLPAGKRVSPEGNVYYEYRDSMSDRLAPNYPKNAPYLVGGGDVGKNLENMFNLAKQEILQDIENGFIDGEVYSFEDLYDYVDANCYGGICENNYKISENYELENKLYEKLDDWIKNGGLDENNFELGGRVELNDVEVKAYKSFHGLKAENYFENVNGYDWNVITMKRYSGDLVSSARGGKHINSDGVEMFSFDWDSPSIMLVSSKPSRVTEKVVEAQQKLALEKFKEKMESGNFADGGYNEGIEEDIDMTDDYVLRVNKGVEPKDRASMREFIAKTNESREAMTYELGGAFMQTDLAGNTGGGTSGLNAKMALSGVSGTHYTGLVGETGALSSGEMFASGGGVGKIKVGQLLTLKRDMIVAYDHSQKSEKINKGEKLEVVSISPNNPEFLRLKKVDGSINNIGARVEDFEMFADGGNLSRDRKYVNYREDYEVRYAKGKNRHGYGNLKFAVGGSVMANQQIIDDASQHYVNYYLNDGASAGMFKDGGAIKNQYAGRSPMDIWDNLTREQKSHFLHDHQDEIAEVKNLRKLTKNEISEGYYSDWIGLDDDFKNAFAEHTSRGQYATGGMMPKVSTRKHRND